MLPTPLTYANPSLAYYGAAIYGHFYLFTPSPPISLTHLYDLRLSSKGSPCLSALPSSS